MFYYSRAGSKIVIAAISFLLISCGGPIMPSHPVQVNEPKPVNYPAPPAPAKPPKIKIAPQQYYRMCETKDVQACPVDPRTGKKHYTCEYLFMACGSSLNQALRIPQYKDPKKYFDHAVRSDNDCYRRHYGNACGPGGMYLVLGHAYFDATTTEEIKKAIRYQKMYEDYRKRHLKQVFFLYQNRCEDGSRSDCTNAATIFRDEYRSVKSFFPNPSIWWRDQDYMRRNHY